MWKLCRLSYDGPTPLTEFAPSENDIRHHHHRGKWPPLCFEYKLISNSAWETWPFYKLLFLFAWKFCLHNERIVASKSWIWRVLFIAYITKQSGDYFRGFGFRCSIRAPQMRFHEVVNLIMVSPWWRISNTIHVGNHMTAPHQWSNFYFLTQSIAQYENMVSVRESKIPRNFILRT